MSAQASSKGEAAEQEGALASGEENPPSDPAPAPVDPMEAERLAIEQELQKIKETESPADKEAKPGGDAPTPTLAATEGGKADKADPDAPICIPYVDVGGVGMGTVATVVMDLSQQTLYVRKGPNPDGAFARHQLASA